MINRTETRKIFSDCLFLIVFAVGLTLFLMGLSEILLNRAEKNAQPKDTQTLVNEIYNVLGEEPLILLKSTSTNAINSTSSNPFSQEEGIEINQIKNPFSK